MTISRTMSISFVPAMFAAAMVVSAVGERPVRRNLGLGAAASLVVAAPWWWANWDYVSSYLLSSGYGSRSNFYGQAMIAGRVVDHLSYLLRDFRVLLPLGVFVAVLAGIKGVHDVWRSPREWIARNRDLIAIWVAIALMTMALLSSSNRGVWFAAPLDCLLVVGVVAAGTRLLRVEEPIGIRRVLSAAVAATLMTLLSWANTGIGVVVGLIVLVVAGAMLVSIRSRRSVALGMLVVGVSVCAIAASVPFVGPLARLRRLLASYTTCRWPRALSRDGLRVRCTPPVTRHPYAPASGPGVVGRCSPARP
ncbi:MAG: hypothetical protein M5U19_09575 [Microthrixaceae bacterium]|nr:hypothetical protein [Microthrixaceae bacterium]